MKAAKKLPAGLVLTTSMLPEMIAHANTVGGKFETFAKFGDVAHFLLSGGK